MIKKYIKKNIEVEAIQFTENNINEVLDFICNGDPFEMCFVESREEVIASVKKHKYMYIEYTAGRITVYYNQYIVKTSNLIFEVLTEKEFKEFYQETDDFIDLNKLKNYECFTENANIMTQYSKIKEEINEFYLEFMYKPNGERIIAEGLDVMTAMYNYLSMIGLSKEDFDKHIAKLDRYVEIKKYGK